MNRVLANDYRQGLTSIMGAVILVLSLFAAHIVIATSFALLAAGLAFFSWKSCYRRLRAIADTPSSRIASAAQGHVELIGTLRALPGFPLHGPLSGESCVWYRYWERRCTGIGWKRSAGETEAPFMMEDGSGACLVMPRGAEMTGLDPISRRKGNPRSPSKGDYEAMEWLLREGDEAHVVGRFSTLSGSSLDAFIDAQAAACTSLRSCSTVQAASRGSARNSRQNAVATGPTSDRRTKIGAKAMPMAPANSAARAHLPWLIGRDEDAGRGRCGCVRAAWLRAGPRRRRG